MALTLASEFELSLTVGDQEEDAALLDTAHQGEEQVDGGAIGPLGIVEDEQEGEMGGEAGDDVGVLLEDLALVNLHGHGLAPLLTADEAGHLLGQTDPFAHVTSEAGEDRGTGYEGTDQVGAPIEEDVGRGLHETLPGSLVLVCGTGYRTGIGEGLEHGAEGEVGVALTGLGVADTDSSDEVGGGFLGAAGELQGEGRLTLAWFAGDEAELTLTGQG